MPQSTNKKTNGAAYQASHAQRLRASKNANFGWGQNLHFCFGDNPISNPLDRETYSFGVKTKQISQFLKFEKRTSPDFNLGFSFGSQFNVDFRSICFII